jgi:hypothetical protein
VPHVLGVAALELGYPVLLLVLPEVDDPPLNRHHPQALFFSFSGSDLLPYPFASNPDRRHRPVG